MTIPYEVRRIPGGVGKAYIREHHYSRSCHNGPMTWGLYEGDDPIGTPAVRRKSRKDLLLPVLPYPKAGSTL